MLGIEELLELEEAVREELNNSLTGILTKLNRTEQIENLLALLDLSHLLKKDTGFEGFSTGKIVVIGQSEVKGEVLLSIGKSLGIAKDRFELCLEYDDAKRYGFQKMQWNPSYCAILVGPMPHSGKAKGDASSIISAIESGDGYPPVYRVGNSGLKITKTSFREKLQELINKEKIARSA